MDCPDCPEYSSLPGFGSSPWIVSFNETETATLIDPFSGHFFKTSVPMLEGKECLRCFGDWLLMFDEESRECFLANITSYSTVFLPPLLEPIDSLGRCALSSQTPPDCTVMFACKQDDRFVLCCRPGDKEWEKHDINLGNSHEIFGGPIFGSKGKMYVETCLGKRRCVVINTTTPGDHYIEKMGMADPDITNHDQYVTFWVESNGDIFLVRVYFHAHQAIGVANIDVYQMDTSRYIWRRVDNIGGATFFLGANCVAVSSQAGGPQADCIYLLLWCYDGIRLYSIRMDDWTISFTLVLPSCTTDPEDWADTWLNLLWAIPPSYRQEPTKSSGTITSKINRSVVLMEDKEQMVSPWSELPVELIELLVPKLSFVDYLHTRAVCKRWSLIEKPIQHARTHPMFMSISTSGDMCRFYDPVVKKEYIVKDNMLLHGNWQTLHFSKYGWVLATKGKRCIYAENPFTKEACKLPKMDRQWFDGISFSSVPKSPDSIIFAIRKYPLQNSVNIMLWRAGDNCWTKEELPCDTLFCMTRSNPVFFDNEFYCLGVHGNLGVFNPNDITWRVLDKPEPVRVGANNCGDRFCHLVEFKGDLIAIFRPYDAKPIEMFMLDQSHMSWEKVMRLDDVVLFLDDWNATINSSQEYGCHNRIYLPFFGSNEVGDDKASAFYDLEDGQYKPKFYGLTEPINSLWIEPNFSRHL